MFFGVFLVGKALENHNEKQLRLCDVYPGSSRQVSFVAVTVLVVVDDSPVALMGSLLFTAEVVIVVSPTPEDSPLGQLLGRPLPGTLPLIGP